MSTEKHLIDDEIWMLITGRFEKDEQRTTLRAHYDACEDCKSRYRAMCASPEAEALLADWNDELDDYEPVDEGLLNFHKETADYYIRVEKYSKAVEYVREYIDGLMRSPDISEEFMVREIEKYCQYPELERALAPFNVVNEVDEIKSEPDVAAAERAPIQKEDSVFEQIQRALSLLFVDFEFNTTLKKMQPGLRNAQEYLASIGQTPNFAGARGLDGQDLNGVPIVQGGHAPLIGRNGNLLCLRFRELPAEIAEGLLNTEFVLVREDGIKYTGRVAVQGKNIIVSFEYTYREFEESEKKHTISVKEILN